MLPKSQLTRTKIMGKKINLLFWKSLCWISVSMEESFFLASNGSEIEASESITIEDPSSTDENNKIVYNKIDSVISKESVLGLKNNRLLSDDIINALQKILSREYPDVKGLHDPALGQALKFKVINESSFV